MDNHTVAQLKDIATDRGIRGYYKLRKIEFIHALETVTLVEQKVAYLISRLQTISFQFYNRHLVDHQISRRKLSKMQFHY